jgi:hypothetical protein
MCVLKTYLYVSDEIDACAVHLHGQVCVYAFPVRVEEFVCEALFLVEEEHDAEVGLLVGAVCVCEGEFGEGVCVGEVIGAWKGVGHLVLGWLGWWR